MQSYVSIILSQNFDKQLFQLAALHYYALQYHKKITIATQPNFVKESKMIDEVTIEDYREIRDNQESFSIIPYSMNIMLCGNFINFKKLSEDTLGFLRNIVYSNEDYMYAAYDEYNKIKAYFDTTDDNDMASIYYNADCNASYYKKAAIIMNKKNYVLFMPFTPDKSVCKQITNDSEKVYIYWNDNIYIRFILLTFFKHNIIQSYDSYFSIWAAYISSYDSVKDLVIPCHLKPIISQKVGNLNINYV